MTFTGREDDGTGLYYYRARYYDPNLEVFISQDPLGDAQRYVGGNPINYIDPLGLTWRDNPSLFFDWVFNQGDSYRFYGPNDPSTKEIMQTQGAADLRKQAKNCSKAIGKGGIGTPDAYFESLSNPLNGTQVQVGGFNGTFKRTGNGRIVYRVTNTLSQYSFLYHLPFLGKPSRGETPLMGNIEQVFMWIEADPCDCQK